MKQGHSLTYTKANSTFKSLLFFYPESYRKKFGSEMLITFEDMYHEQLAKHGKTGFIFWLMICLDIIRSSFEQHGDLLKKQGMKKYIHNTLHINKYNIIGGVLLLPFFSMFVIDLVARIWQGDLVHYNRPVYAYLSHTPLYWFPVLFSISIIFPALAVLINIMPLIQNSIKKHGSPFRVAFIRQNMITLFLVFVGLGFLAIIKFHDFAPCALHGLLKVGVQQLSHIINVCRNA